MCFNSCRLTRSYAVPNLSAPGNSRRLTHLHAVPDLSAPGPFPHPIEIIAILVLAHMPSPSSLPPKGKASH